MKDAVELAARRDPELGEDLAQVILDGASADVQATGNLGVRQPIAGQPGDLRLLSGEFASSIDPTLAGSLAGGAQLPPGSLGEGLHPIRLEHLDRDVQLVTGFRLVGFATASAVGGAAVNFAMLATARAVQGAFAAVLAPSALSLLATTFTIPEDRRRAFGVYGAITGAGGAVGLVLGGLLTQYLSWRWCLYINLLFAAVAVLGAIMLLRHQTAPERTRLDPLGALLVSGGMFSVVDGFSNAATHSWQTPSTWAFLVVGAVGLVLFALWERRAPSPLLPLRVVADRNRAGAYLATLLAGAGIPWRDTGVASATLNTGNQLGGSIGTSLLNTIFAGAIASYVAANATARTFVSGHASPRLIAAAGLHGYTTAFWWTSGIFLAGALICGGLMRSGPLSRWAQAGQAGRPAAMPRAVPAEVGSGPAPPEPASVHRPLPVGR